MMEVSTFSYTFVLVSLLEGNNVLGSDKGKRELFPEDREVFAELRNTLTELEKTLESIVCNLSQEITGSTYTIWGRTACQSDRTEMVYSGLVGGSKYDHKGATVDYLCLPKNPDWNVYQDGHQGDNGYVYGAEYETFYVGVDKGLTNYDVPCAVCRTHGRTSVLMIPGKTTCHNDWTKEYSGYLMSGYFDHPAATQYVCVDKAAEKMGNNTNLNGKLLYLVEAQCGSLPCPPYVNGRELTCVVCSK